MRRLILLMFCLIFGSLISECLGQEDFPSGEELFARCVKAIGSEEALKKVKSIQFESTIKLNQGMTATCLSTKSSDGKMKISLTISGNETQLFVNGDTAWMDQSGVLTKLEGPQKTLQLLTASTFLPLDYRKYFDSVKTTGITKFEGVKCYEVECMKNGKNVLTYSFSKDSGLEAGYWLSLDVPGVDPLELTLVFQDYKGVEGLQLAHRTIYRYPAYDQTMTVEKWTVNGKVEPSQFKIPERLK